MSDDLIAVTVLVEVGTLFAGVIVFALLSLVWAALVSGGSR